MNGLANIVHPALIVRLHQTFRPGMSDLELYEATRGVWKVGPRREAVLYVLAVHAGIVQEVYEVHHWQPAGTDRYETRTFEPELLRGRSEFRGARASDEVRDRYIGKSVHQYVPAGSQNPVAYVNVP